MELLPSKTQELKNPTYVVLSKQGIVLLILSMISVLSGVWLDEIHFLFVGLPIPIAFIWYSRFLLEYHNFEVSISLSIPSTQIKAKQFLPVHLTLNSSKRIQGMLQIEVTDGLFPVVSTNSAVIDTEIKSGYTFLFLASKRGREKIQRLSIQFSGLIGLFHLVNRIGLNQEILVLPEAQRITLPWSHRQKILDRLIAEVSTPVKGRGSDFLSLKDFTFGDEVRHIHWKASAKFDRLISKEFEEPKMLRFLLVVDSSLFMTGPKLEFALSAAIELATIFQKSHHTLSILIHGEKNSRLFKLGNSITAVKKLAIDLHEIKAEGTGFDYSTLQRYMVNHHLIGNVVIVLSDLEHEPNVILQGMTILKPYYQALFFLACNSTGFGTLALRRVQEETVVSQDQLFYRREIIEPQLERIYDQRAREYRKLIEGPNARFRIIESYNTNILLELQALISLFPKATKITIKPGGF
ncbi:MAG: DUF58 domain-containing protein [Candidatus Kariarchaeaceae archaeon]|jgi:uncharacterized protein (DUF58 family)